MNRRAIRCCLVALAAPLMLSSRASANGRFPAASQLVVDPSDPARLAVRTTFGLMQSTDRGASFRWICERALGYEGVYDPAIAVPGDGSLLIALPDGLSRSSDRGCVWKRAGAPVAGEYIIDLAIDPNDPKRVVAITALAEGSPMGSQAKLFESLDSGATFTRTVLLPEDFRPQTVDLAKGAPKRIYASGLSPFARFAMVVRSDDAGATWTEATFDIADGRGAYIAGVDPTNPDRLYLRIDGESADDLLFSPDGAGSINKILSGPQLLGFAIAPDGKGVAAGGPGMGVHVAGPDHSFKKVADHGVQCLTWSTEGLYACGRDPLDPFAIGRSTDGTSAFSTLLRLADLEPLRCDKGTTTEDLCPAFWPEVSRLIGKTGGVDAGPDATPMIDAGTDAGADAATPSTPPSDDEGCGCAVPGRGAAPTALVALALLAASGLRRRKR